MPGKIIIAPNAFKGSLSAVQAAEAVAAGVRAVFPGREIIQVPLADGGDGTTECIVRATGGRIFQKKVTGPLGDPVEGFWGLTGDGAMAVVETAAASGLALVAANRRDPLRATSFGTGELIREALRSGCRSVFVGLGGSATCDAGAGALQALGVRMLDRSGRAIGRGAASLGDLDCIDPAPALSLLGNAELVLGCDVDNPLYGPRGAAYIYAPQKGAAAGQLPLLDQGLRRFAAVVAKDLNRRIDSLPGGGAAGGIGGGMAGVLGARLVSGIETIMELAGLPRLLREGGASLVITGEGEINAQSLHGKVPVGVARLARGFGVPVLILAGKVSLDQEAAEKEGIAAMLSIMDGPATLAEAMERAAALLENAARRAMLLLRLGSRFHGCQ
jgi:glycerate kinase